MYKVSTNGLFKADVKRRRARNINIVTIIRTIIQCLYKKLLILSTVFDFAMGMLPDDKLGGAV